MTTKPEFTRKNIRLPASHYSGRRCYFLTLCFDGRRRFGSNPRIARWLITRLEDNAKRCNFHIHAYCVMPDHVHILAAAASDESSLLKFAESFKQETAVELLAAFAGGCGSSSTTTVSCARQMPSTGLPVTSG